MTARNGSHVVVCGAGIAGAAATWWLVRTPGIERVTLVERDAPLSLTSDKSTECFRNWWPGPDEAMTRLATRSIEAMDALAARTDDRIALEYRGYLFASADPARAAQFEVEARACASLGAGPLRVHQRDDDGYVPPGDAHAPRSGADLLCERASIHAHYPWLCTDVETVLHVRGAGTLSAQQLGMTLLEEARAEGAEYVRGAVRALDVHDDAVRAVHIESADGPRTFHDAVLVDAAGPYLDDVARLAGLALPVVCERHAKLSFADRDGVLPRDAPLAIWCDPTPLPWTDDERDALASDDATRALLEPFPAGVHGRPVGAGDSVMLYWTYDCPVETPRFPVTADPHYPEILMRGMSVMVPGLARYHERIPGAYVDGGYYTKTPDNRPLIGPTPIAGLHLMGAFSGFGIMVALGAGELLAAHVGGNELPAHASAFSLARFDDPRYRAAMIDAARSAQL